MDEDVEIWVFVSKGCPHCPEAEKLCKVMSREYNVPLRKYRLQTSEGKEMAKQYDVLGTPTIMVWKGEDLFARLIGTPSRGKLEGTLKKALGLKKGLFGLFG